MKLCTTIFLSFALVAVKAYGNKFINGEFCDLQTSIQCHVKDANGNTGMKCEDLITFDLSTCSDGGGHNITAVYSFTYANNNEEGRIEFLTSVNPESTKIPKNDYTFGRANTNNVFIERGDRIQTGEIKVFHPERVIDPCRVEPKLRNRFVAELQMNGHVVGHNGDQRYSCSQRSFYSHTIDLFTPAPSSISSVLSPTVAPVAATLAPIGCPEVAPTPAPTVPAPTVQAPTVPAPIQGPSFHPTTSLAPSKSSFDHSKGKSKSSSKQNRNL